MEFIQVRWDISPSGSFDFNVLIRSLFHNADTEKIEASVGGAITFKQCRR